MTMETNIMQTVYDSLESATTEIGQDVAELEEIQAKINSGRYSDEALQKEFFPVRDALKSQISHNSEKALNTAKGIIDQYRQESERLNDLDSSLITDDIKLLQAGVTLLPRDIDAIIERNKDNRTMIQLTMRYAQEHGIDVSNESIINSHFNEERKKADALDDILKYYAHWIDKKDALEMLKKFFNA